MSVFLLKIIAVICMVCDHIRYVIPSCNSEVMRAIGRIAFPIFAYIVVEGYQHTKDIKKYIKRLLIFAFISQIPFSLFMFGCEIVDVESNMLKNIHMNVMFTLLFGVLSIYSFDKCENKVLKITIPVVLVMLGHFIDVDYGAVGIIIIWIFYLFRNTMLFKCIAVPIIFISNLLYRTKLNPNSIDYCIPYFIGYMISGALLTLYNGKPGKYKLKYAFYLFYPIHMIIFYLIYKYIH